MLSRCNSAAACFRYLAHLSMVPSFDLNVRWFVSRIWSGVGILQVFTRFNVCGSIIVRVYPVARPVFGLTAQIRHDCGELVSGGTRVPCLVCIGRRGEAANRGRAGHAHYRPFIAHMFVKQVRRGPAERARLQLIYRSSPGSWRAMSSINPPFSTASLWQ